MLGLSYPLCFRTLELIMVKLDLGKAREGATTSPLSLKDTQPSQLTCRASSRTPDQIQAPHDSSGYCEVDISDGVEEYIDDIAQRVKEIEAGYKQGLYRQYGRSCLAANQLMRDDNSWKAFINSNFWENTSHRPREKDRPDALRFTLQRAVTGCTRRGKQRASKISRGLEYLLTSGVDPKDIPDAIKSGGGIEALAVNNSKSKRDTATAKDFRDRQVRREKAPASSHRTVKWTGSKAELALEYPISTRLRLLVELGEPSKQGPTLLVHDLEEVLHE